MKIRVEVTFEINEHFDIEAENILDAWDKAHRMSVGELREACKLDTPMDNAHIWIDDEGENTDWTSSTQIPGIPLN